MTNYYKKCLEENKIIEQLLDNTVYKEAGFTNFKRYEDLERQFKGIDTEFLYKLDNQTCDEKCAIQYRNTNLTTFALDLGYINEYNKPVKGWYLREQNKTNSYLFVWLNRTEAQLNSPDDIHEFQVALVRKEDISNYLKARGWTAERLALKTKKILECPGKEYMGDMKTHGLKFFYTAKYRVVNILIPRQALLDMAIFKKTYDDIN